MSAVVLPELPAPDMGTLLLHGKSKPISMGHSIEAMRAYGQACAQKAIADGVRISIPDSTMQQEFATHYNKGYKDGAEAARKAATDDTERLNYLIGTGAHISWSQDSEVCSVWLPAERDGTEPRPVGGFPQKCHYDPREAIDAARNKGL